MKKIILSFIVLLVLILPCCEIERKFKSDVIDTLCDTIQDEYEFIDSTKVKRSQGKIVIYIHFSSNEYETFDEALHEKIESFFLDEDNQDKIIEKYDSSQLEGATYPIIEVQFVDKENIDSHFIRSPIEFVNHGKSWVSKKKKKKWTEPHYYNQDNKE